MISEEQVKVFLISYVVGLVTLFICVPVQTVSTYTTLDVPGGTYLRLRHRRPPEGSHILATRGPRARPDDPGETARTETIDKAHVSLREIFVGKCQIPERTISAERLFFGDGFHDLS